MKRNNDNSLIKELKDKRSSYLKKGSYLFNQFINRINDSNFKDKTYLLDLDYTQGNKNLSKKVVSLYSGTKEFIVKKQDLIDAVYNDVYFEVTENETETGILVYCNGGCVPNCSFDQARFLSVYINEIEDMFNNIELLHDELNYKKQVKSDTITYSYTEDTKEDVFYVYKITKTLDKELITDGNKFYFTLEKHYTYNHLKEILNKKYGAKITELDDDKVKIDF